MSQTRNTRLAAKRDTSSCSVHCTGQGRNQLTGTSTSHLTKMVDTIAAIKITNTQSSTDLPQEGIEAVAGLPGTVVLVCFRRWGPEPCVFLSNGVFWFRFPFQSVVFFSIDFSVECVTDTLVGAGALRTPEHNSWNWTKRSFPPQPNSRLSLGGSIRRRWCVLFLLLLQLALQLPVNSCGRPWRRIQLKETT